MLTIFHDDLHQLRYDVLKSAAELAGLGCKRFKLNDFSLFNKRKKNIILISHPGNYLKSLIISSYFFIFGSPVIIDFYDLHLVRGHAVKVPKKLIIVESLLVFLAKGFFSRSGEMNYLRKLKPDRFTNKRIILIPDLNYSLEAKCVSDLKPEKYLLVGGTFIPALKKFISKNLNSKFLFLGMPQDYQCQFEQKNNTIFQPSLNLSFDILRSKNFDGYCGIHFVDTKRMLYRRSAAIKYMTYIELGLVSYADKCHRVARFYSYLFPQRVRFFDKEQNIQCLNHRVDIDQANRAKKRISKLKKMIVDGLNEVIKC